MSSRKTWAEAQDASPQLNCGTCHLRDRCPDPRKSRRFACTLWMDGVEKDDPSARDFLDLMRDLVRRETVVADPLAIDDRVVPWPANSYVWNCSPGYLEFRPSPFPKQLELSLKLYGDMCSYCRGPWYDDIPYDCDIADIPKKVMLREYGICPRCGKTRLDGINSGRERDFNTLVSVLGQRSGKSVGMSLIVSYHLAWLIKIKNPSSYYRIKSGTVLYNHMVGLRYTDAKTNVFDPLTAAMGESPWFQCIAEGSPVIMADGSRKPIETVQKGEHVRTLEGSEEVTNVFDNGVREIVELTLDNGSVLRATYDHRVRCVVSGVLVWKAIKDLEEDDVVVVEDDEILNGEETQ